MATILRTVLICLVLAAGPGRADDIFRQPRAENTKQLIEWLGDENLRQGAAEALAAIGAPAVPALIERLQSERDEVAVWSAYTLGKIGPAAAPASGKMAAAMKSSDVNLRAVVARSLGQIRTADAAAIDALAEALSDDSPRVRRYAATALGEIGPAAKSAVPALIAGLADESIRLLARKTLTQIGPLAVPALREALADNAIRLDAADALRTIDPEAARAAGVDQTSRDDFAALAQSIANTERDAATRAAHATEIGRLGEDAAPVLIAVFDDPSLEVTRAATAAFREIGTVALPQLQAALGHESPRVRANTADALAAVGTDAEPAVGDLAKLLSDPDRDVRNRTAAALDELGEVADAAVPALINSINDARELEATRQLAIKALAQTGPASRDTVIQALREVNHQGNFGVRSLAEEMLKRIESNK